MTIEVLLFAQLRDAFGTDRVTIQVAEGRSAAQAAAQALAAHAEGKYSRLTLRYAVDDAFVEGDFRLSDGDTLALIPPVSGG